MENDFTIHGLLRRRSEIAGSIAHLEGQVEAMRADLLHIDAALRIMGYDGEGLGLPLRKACTSGLFHRKEMLRLVIGFLRANTDGMTARELASLISVDKGWDSADRRLQNALTDKISHALSKWKKRGFVEVEKRAEGYFWQIGHP